jgi:plastocyanin domain-containing protein
MTRIPSVLAFVTAFFLLSAAANAQGVSPNVNIAAGVQTIVIEAGEGYSPEQTIAKAGIPSVLQMKTTGTIDCSLALVIPQLSYRATLPVKGETAISVPAQARGSKLRGLCSMAMYSFEITFN